LTHGVVHPFVYLHSSKTSFTIKCVQDNKAAYAALTAALYNWAIKHSYISRSLKSTVLTDHLKTARLVKLTESGKLFHTLMTLQAKN